MIKIPNNHRQKYRITFVFFIYNFKSSSLILPLILCYIRPVLMNIRYLCVVLVNYCIVDYNSYNQCMIIAATWWTLLGNVAWTRTTCGTWTARLGGIEALTQSYREKRPLSQMTFSNLEPIFMNEYLVFRITVRMTELFWVPIDNKPTLI